MSTNLYHFLGYKILEIRYKNKNNDSSYITISVPQDNYNKKKSIYSFLIKITTDFGNDDNYFLFQADFEIYNIDEFNNFESNEKKAYFLRIVFPFIREKIFSITSDTDQGLLLPTIDIRNFNFDCELKLIKA
ncbi:MAG: hypothetical protein SO253_06480 [Bacilli bacterium]|nr:hypothetical protein [Bacilli bacterium]